MDQVPLPASESEVIQQGGLPPTGAANLSPPDGKPAEPLSKELADLYFLIANFLTNASPCSRAAAVLQQELVSRVFKREAIPRV